MKDFGLLGVAMLLGGVGLYLNGAGDEQANYAILAFLAAAVVFCAQIVVASTRKGVLVTSVLAAGCNAYLLNLKFAPHDKAICDVGGLIGCSVINSSPASELFGLPVTLYGVGFYVGLALAALGNEKRTPRFDQVNGLFALGSLAFSAYLGWEAKKIGLFCPFCITIYACNILLFVAALKGLRENGQKLFDGVDKIFGSSSLWVITAAFAFITLVGASSWQGHEASSDVAIVKNREDGGKIDTDALRRLYKRPDGVVKTDGTEPVLGRPGATITIVEFADYGCPHCAMASPLLKELVHGNPEVQLLFKVFPLSGACNPVIEGTEGVERCKAAMAAECAGDQGKYYEMSGIMFKSLGYRSDDDLLFMAREVGLDTEAWTTCMQTQSTIDAVLDDAKAGIEARVQGTPTMFVRGLVGDDFVEITQGPEALLALIEAKRDGIPLPPPL
ncbi:MAG: thioredoxin domain-containing protein [Myxococcales bacterium]|nr:thioredoxin domain-containing protein [Myxococcales bacterium]